MCITVIKVLKSICFRIYIEYIHIYMPAELDKITFQSKVN